MTKLGIVGCGFVGSAVAEGFKLDVDLKIYDKFKAGFDSLEDVCNQDIIFFCVPTPMKSDGTQNLSIMIQAIESIASETAGKILVIKSTVLPGTTMMFQKKYQNHHFVSNPEFLTARSARLDFINAARIIIGAYDDITLSVMYDLYRKRFSHTPIYLCKPEEAELVKYMANCFFATKITYLNEFYDLCEYIGIDFDVVKEMWLADGRIGNSHHQVPGHDGDKGYGGTCFPKDMSALIHWAREIGNPLRIIEIADAVNKKIRKKQDWTICDED
jgi:nucleotide sugar dehydrogenase